MYRQKLTLQTSHGPHAIAIEVPETVAEQQTGLMFRQSLPENSGMLFLYAASQEVTMWMKDTGLSLDMVFIRADGQVHRIEPHVEPLSERIIASRGAVVAVLELAAGSAKRLGLKVGDRVELSQIAPRGRR